MKTMFRALLAGFRAVARNYGLVLLVLALNLGLTLPLAVPFMGLLGRDLAHTGASGYTMYGFDYDWWRLFDEGAEGPAGSFAPDLLGTGFAFRNFGLLLGGHIPGGLFPTSGPGPDAAILGLGALYLLLQVFLTGGLIGVFRAPQGGWTFRGLAHGCGFYFGRLLRVSLLSLAAAGILFAANLPFSRWVDGVAREAVSERTALALTLGRYALLLLALVAVHMVSSFAKVIVVVRERRSAFLAFAASAGFCARHLATVVGQYLVVAALGIATLLAFGSVDARLNVVGWKTQLVALALFESFVAIRIAVRLGLLAAQVDLLRAHGR